MSDGLLIVLVLGMLVVAGLVAWVIDRRTARRLASFAAPLMAPAPPPSPIVVAPPAPTPPPAPKPARDLITIRLVSASGRDLGTIQMDRKSRRPTLSHRPRRSTATATFVADRQHNGHFVYRQVGQERE